jgi:hypothetical protein
MQGGATKFSQLTFSPYFSKKCKSLEVKENNVNGQVSSIYLLQKGTWSCMQYPLLDFGEIICGLHNPPDLPENL